MTRTPRGHKAEIRLGELEPHIRAHAERHWPDNQHQMARALRDLITLGLSHAQTKDGTVKTAYLSAMKYTSDATGIEWGLALAEAPALESNAETIHWVDSVYEDGDPDSWVLVSIDESPVDSDDTRKIEIPAHEWDALAREIAERTADQ